MTVTQKGIKEVAAASTAEEFQKYYQESVANGEEEKEEDSTLDREKRERDIADWIGRPVEPPSRNEDEEAEGEEEDVGATQASKEDNTPIDKYDGGREFEWEEDREDTVLSDEKKTKIEASSRHEGESLLSDSSDYDDNDDDDDENGAKYNTC